MSQRDTFGTQAGFTLIELLVSLTLLGVILALLTNALQVVSKNWDAHARAIDDLDMLSRAADILQRDIAGLQRVTSALDERNPRFLFAGDASHLSFIALEPPFPTEAGPYFIDYSVAPSGSGLELVRARAPYEAGMPGFSGASPANRVSLLQGPYAYRFTYAESTNGRLNWYPRWPFDQRLPALIRLDVLDAQSGEPAGPGMVAAVRAGAELGCISIEAGPCSTGGDLKPGSSRQEKAKAKENEQSPTSAPQGAANASAP